MLCLDRQKGFPQEGTLGWAWKGDLEVSRQRKRKGRADLGKSPGSQMCEDCTWLKKRNSQWLPGQTSGKWGGEARH